MLCTREEHFFNPKFMNPSLLNANVVLVKLDGTDVYLDPGTPFTPFGLLPWNETGIQGLHIGPDGGTWIRMPDPSSTNARLERTAALQLDQTGTLSGTLTVTYSGLEAASQRLSEHYEDETQRRTYLEQQVEYAVPSGINITLTNHPDWDGVDSPLVAEFEFQVGGWAAPAGRRLLLPVGLFGSGEQHIFEHASRVHPLYFTAPYERVDDVTIKLPPEWQVDAVPALQDADQKVLRYHLEADKGEGSVRLRRELALNLMYLDPKYYNAVRNFFQSVRAGDEEQVLLSVRAVPVRL
jgi:hypothetical protein